VNIRIYRSAFIVLAGVVVATMGIVLLPDPNASMTDYLEATEIIKKVEVIRHDRGSSDYFDLEVSTQSDRLYHVRQPEPDDIRRYAAALPVGHEVSIRYRSEMDGKLIYDIREGDRIYVPFAELIKEAAGKRSIILVASACLLLLGLIAMVWEFKMRQQ
jgi:hypothetical protein